MKIKLFFAVMAVLTAFSFTTLENAAGPWELLGSRVINYGLDRDEILVTRSEGVFTAIQLRVKRGPINMHKLVVHYGNGESDEIELRENFSAGSESRVIDLKGNKRIIRKVVMWYDTKNLSNRRGIVELWGKH